MKQKWWKESIVYQIYPRSFMDSNNDGIGDLKGITGKLDYLKKLGVDILWLSPIFRSPNADNGYDVSDYYDIMPDFGIMSDFDELLAAAHRKGLRIILDLVVNHTSDEHPWFIESRSSKNNPKRDYYIWHKGRDGKEPNNWASFFTGSAWEKDQVTNEYYLHLFSKKQPDLNWANPAVRSGIYEMMKWWLDKGIDGFRMDVINFLAKPLSWPDAPNQKKEQFVFYGPIYANNEHMHEILQEMNREVLSKYDIMTVGECHFISPETGLLYVEENRHELDMLFHFDILVARHDTANLKKYCAEWYRVFNGKAWQTVSLGNHDSPRQVSAVGDDMQYRMQSAKLLAVFLLTAPGTPYLYQGEEIGMANVSFPCIEDYRDVETLSRFSEAVRNGRDPCEVLQEVRPLSRDNARTPMQWNATENAGFTKEKPWIGVNPDYVQVNVAAQSADPGSVLSFYRSLIAFRKKHLTLVYGDFRIIEDGNPSVFAYTRGGSEERFLVIMNFSSAVQEVDSALKVMGDLFASCRPQVLFTNYGRSGVDLCNCVLSPWEAMVIRIPVI